MAHFIYTQQGRDASPGRTQSADATPIISAQRERSGERLEVGENGVGKGIGVGRKMGDKRNIQKIETQVRLSCRGQREAPSRLLPPAVCHQSSRLSSISPRATRRYATSRIRANQ